LFPRTFIFRSVRWPLSGGYLTHLQPDSHSESCPTYSSPHSRLRCAYHLGRGTTYSPDSSIRVLPVDTPPPCSQTVTRLLRSSTFVFRCSPFQPVYYLQIFLPYTIAGLPLQFIFPYHSIIPFAAASLQSFSILYPPTLILFRQTPLTSTPQKASARHLSPYLSTTQLCAVCDMLYRPSRSSPNPSTSLSTSIGIQFGRFGLIPNYTPTLCFAFTCYALHVYLRVHTSYVPLYDSYKCPHTLSLVSFTNLTRLRLLAAAIPLFLYGRVMLDNVFEVQYLFDV